MGVEPRRLSQPEPLKAHHDLSQFECGKPTLDQWLRSHAMANEGTSSRTFVVCDDGATVVGYYTLATGSVGRVRQRGVISAVALGHRQAALAVMCRG